MKFPVIQWNGLPSNAHHFITDAKLAKKNADAPPPTKRSKMDKTTAQEARDKTEKLQAKKSNEDSTASPPAMQKKNAVDMHDDGDDDDDDNTQPTPSKKSKAMDDFAGYSLEKFV